MPELLEVESYRVLSEAVLGREVTDVRTPDSWILKHATTPAQLRTFIGDRFVTSRRRGKLLLLDSERGATLGVRFGMTGVLEVDDTEGVEQLRYASTRRDPRWVRFEIEFGAGRLALRDARRLGGIEFEPDENVLGPDATRITLPELRHALDSAAPLKARLMDQHRVAGLGNLLTDELLWRAGLDPARPARSLSKEEERRLHRHLRRTLRDLAARGGSHMGDLQDARVPGAHCPRDGTVLERRTVGGRTTYSCPAHQA